MAKAKSTDLMKWDEELAKQAEIAAGMETGSVGQFFSIRSGILSWQDSPMPNNQMAVIIVDAILENVFYEGKFDPDTPQSPTCFAFGRVEADMVPHKVVFDAGNQQCDTCANCPMNEFGSADTGRGKACRNTRRLALIPAGTLDAAGQFTLIDDLDHFASTPIGFMKLPVTSVRGYAGYVKQVAGVLRRPPHGVITKIKVVPDSKTQFRILFEGVGPVPDDVMGAIMDRHVEAKSIIDFPYSPIDAEEEPKPRSRAAQKPAAKPRSRAAQKPAAKSRKY